MYLNSYSTAMNLDPYVMLYWLEVYALLESMSGVGTIKYMACLQLLRVQINVLNI